MHLTHEMDTFKLRQLMEKQKQCLQNCQEKIKKWTRFREDYEVLRMKLTSLPDKFSYNTQVPFGNLAFMSGKILHTNEILVLLGDGWFVEQSANEACGIVDRRIANCDGTLKELEVERNHLESWLQQTGEVHDEMDRTVEIIETYDEEAEKLWKERHRVSVKKCKEIEDRAMVSDSVTLDVEVLETANDENINILELGDVEDYLSGDSHDSSLKLSDYRDNEPMVEMQKTVTNASSSGAKEKKVRFKKSDIIYDTDKESQRSTVKVAFSSECTANSNLSMTEGDQSSISSITSPADIFKYFGGGSVEISVNQTKSILKQSSSLEESQIASTLDSKIKSSNDVASNVHEKPCTDVVVEHKTNSDSNFKVAEPRPVSLFKTRKSSAKR